MIDYCVPYEPCFLLLYCLYYIAACDCTYILSKCIPFITVLHAMQTRSSDENSVRPSVRPSVTRVNCDKTVKRSVQIYIPYERTFSLVF